MDVVANGKPSHHQLGPAPWAWRVFVCCLPLDFDRVRMIEKLFGWAHTMILTFFFPPQPCNYFGLCLQGTRHLGLLMEFEAVNQSGVEIDFIDKEYCPVVSHTMPQGCISTLSIPSHAAPYFSCLISGLELSVS